MNLVHFLRNLMLPLERIDVALPKSGLIYDIGCGMGVISRYIASHSQRTVVGLDHRLNKVRKVYESINLSFVESDALDYDYLMMNGAILSDFLHHLPVLSQNLLLKILSKKIKNGGVLIIKEIDASDGWRTWASRFWDFLFYPEDEINYRQKFELRQYLESLGFRVQVSAEVPWFLGSTHLFVCKKL